MILQLIIVLTVLDIRCNTEETKPKRTWAFVGNPLAQFRPCNGSDEVTIQFEGGRPPGEENQYYLNVFVEIPQQSKARLQFDSEAYVTLADPDKARITTSGDTFLITFFKSAKSLAINVKGPASGSIPYIKSLVINTEEFCENPETGYLDSLIIGAQPSASVSLTVPDGTCGRRKVDHTELIVTGLPTKPGDWPWHVALYRFSGGSLNYICGGTLISKTLVLTAAHCVTFRGAPVLAETINVVLGKYNLVGGDTLSEERQVHEIVVHENFEYRVLNNDIALLKLKSEAVYNDYIQPACLWHKNAYKKLPPGQVFGTVVGWGFDQTDTLSSQLQQAKMPKVSESTCLKSNPVFFAKMLNSQKFCAGYQNGTSACNGDSGGGFVVFVPDTPGNAAANATGAWHVRGIVSTSVSRQDAPICDPTHFVIFTDTAKYKGWISKYMN